MREIGNKAIEPMELTEKPAWGKGKLSLVCSLTACAALFLTLGSYLDRDLAVTILTGLGAFFGLNYSIRQHDKRDAEGKLEEQRKAQQAHELQMRREIYLSAIEAIADAIIFIARHSDSNLSHDQHQQIIREMPSRIGKIHVVGSDRMIAAVLGFQKKFSAAALNLAPMRTELMIAKDQKDFWLQRKEFWKSIKDASWTRPLNDNEVNNIREAESQAISEFKKTNLFHAQKICAVARDSLRIAHTLLPEYIELNMAARADLGFDPLPTGVYEQRMMDFGAEARDAAMQLIDEMEERFLGAKPASKIS